MPSLNLSVHNFLSLKTSWIIVIYAFLDILCVGFGMGVPIFCIFLGAPVGWYLARRVTTSLASTRETLKGILLGAAVAAAITLILMAVLWGSSLPRLFGPRADLENYGIPMILYDPVASFIGWMALMIFVSPALQFLMVLFGAHLTWLYELSHSSQPNSGVG